MSDTWRLNAIVLAILIIADKKISQAGYDKTIKGVINKPIDKTKGKYQVRYQDSLFEAYSTSAKILYIKDQEVNVLIPGNDWDRRKTILNGVEISATNYQQVPIAGLQYNNIGPNGISFKENITQILLSSYVGDEGIVKNVTQNLNINNTDLVKYIKKGDSLALGMKVRTAFADGQIGGNYGLRFNLVFKDNITGAEVVKTFQIDTSDVIGHPYQLTSPTLVQTLIKDVDTLNFVRVDGVYAFCDGFPSGDTLINDIFITDILINGASALTDELLNGYLLHIDYSEMGNILEGNISTVPVVAQLKINGKITTLDVKYYWFRQNGTIFRGNAGYSGYAGDGWECLNYWTGTSFVPKINGKFNFNKTADNFENNTALAPQKVTKILCVAVYNNRLWIKGLALIINNNAKDIQIISSDLIGDKNRVLYFLDNGSPTLTCKINGVEQLGSNYYYVWSFKPERGLTKELKPSSTASTDPYAAALTAYNTQIAKVKTLDANSVNKYISSSNYITPVNNWNNNFKGKLYIYRNKYYNVPIKKINSYATISCGVYTESGNTKTYIGTGSITLYNKYTLEGTYSLNINNGVQIFQYDEKGNSPYTKEIERSPLDDLPALGFTLLDNTGKLIPYSQIINNSLNYIYWLFPGHDTLLISNLGNPNVKYDSSIERAYDRNISANLYNIYKKKQTFSYSIASHYSLTAINNNIKLIVKYNGILLLAYTDFTFPKNGDPGTNGTDLIAKVSANNVTTDRIYGHRIGSSANEFYGDSGANIDSLKFLIYNNNNVIYNTASFWSCPPRTTASDSIKGNTYFTITPSSDNKIVTLSLKSNTYTPATTTAIVSSADTYKNTNNPINIVRGKRTISKTSDGLNSVDYIAEVPICYVYTASAEYRIKIKPKTGFKYVVYELDGTRPNYDNQPFEIIAERRENIGTSSSPSYIYSTSNITNITCTWTVIGGILADTQKNNTAGYGENSNIRYFKPSDTFDGLDLKTAIIASVNVNGSYIGFIHIPIYKIINRYGHSAINGWDGNSILLGGDDGTILAPQVGAGSKNSSNQFNGVLMGAVKTGDKILMGLFGYNNGQRSIFLDSNTGNAYFGKNTEARINISASDVGIAPRGSIYSSGYYNYDSNGLPASTYSNPDTGKGRGMLIDLIDPTIRFGSGNFVVNSSGHLTAKGGGTVAGWKISDDALTSNNNQVYLRSQNYTTSNPYAIYSNGTFTVTPGGYMTSTSGKIANWNITANRLSQNKVGLNAPASINDNTVAIYAGSSSNTLTDNPFYVTYGGYLRSTSGKIAGWSIGLDDDQDNLTNGRVGLGTYVTTIEGVKGDVSEDGDPVTAKIWSGSGTKPNFAVSNNGYIYSKAGKIGGWNIENNRLWAVGTSGDGIRLNSNGSMNGGSGYNATTQSGGSWSINTDGSSSFTNITTNYLKATNADVLGTIKANAGYIGGWTISNGNLTSGSMSISSGGSMSGPNWSIDANGNATFNRLSGNISGNMSVGSGGSLYGSGGGNWGLGSGGGSVGGWGFGGQGGVGGILSGNDLDIDGRCQWENLQYVTGISSMSANKTTYSGVLPTSQPTYLTNSHTVTTSVSLNVTGTCDGKSVSGTASGSISISIPSLSVRQTNTTSWHSVPQLITGLKLTLKTQKSRILGKNSLAEQDISAGEN